MAESKEELIARLILNTKRKKRIDNLVQISEDILSLSKKLGGIKEVAKILGLTDHMINQFLSVNKLSDSVKNRLVNRELDSVSVVNYIAKYNEVEQEYLADAYIQGDLTSQDIRAIGPLKTKFPEKGISDLVKLVLDSKNIKASVYYVQLPTEYTKQGLQKITANKVGDENVLSVDVKGFLGILKLTREGEEILRKNSKGIGLKQYLEAILKK